MQKFILVDAIESFTLALAVAVAPSTARVYLAGLKRLTQFLGNEFDVLELSRDDLRRWHVWLRGERLSDRSIINYTKAVKRFCSWLVDEQYLPTNPAVVLRIRDTGQKMPRAISEGDYMRLLYLAKETNPRMHLFILLLADTGARVAELVNVLVDDIALDHDRKRGRIMVIGKGDKRRRVNFGRQTYRVLTSWLLFRQDNHPYLFPSSVTGGPLTTNHIRAWLGRLAAAAGCQGRVNPHSFRHRFARIYLQRGGDMGSLSRLLGHSSITVTQQYYALFTDDELDEFHEAIDPARSTLSKRQHNGD